MTNEDNFARVETQKYYREELKMFVYDEVELIWKKLCIFEGLQSETN